MRDKKDVSFLLHLPNSNPIIKSDKYRLLQVSAKPNRQLL